MTSAKATLVLLHGFPMDARLWDRAVPHLSSHFRVLAPDLPGFGGTPPLAGPFTMAAVAGWLCDLLDESAIRSPITLCGMSMGGYIALEFAALYADRLGRLVLCDSKTQADSDEPRRQRLAMITRMHAADAEASLTEIADAMLPRLVSPNTLATDTEAVNHLRSMILACRPRSVADAQAGMAERRDTSEVVRNLQVPLLCVAGEDDALTPPSMMQAIADSAPRGSAVTISQAGHCSPLDKPRAWSDALIRFAEDCLV